VNPREELAAAFLGHLQRKEFDQAKPMLAETVTLKVPQMEAPIQGRDGIMMALQMAADSGQGLNMVGFKQPVQEADGSVKLAGRAPKGALWLLAFILRKARNITITLGFGEGDLIQSMDIAM
jgi:hypothetical protein